MPDIQVLEESKKHENIFMGDVHGSISALDTAIDSLADNQRLFIVGDLTDRGEDSLGVIKRIIEVNAAHPEPRILPIKGNHEMLFLHYSTLKLQGLFNQEFYEAKNLLEANGGDWAFDLDHDDLQLCHDFFSKLPFIIHSKGGDINPAFNVVHADMPFSDEVLLKRIVDGQLDLSRQEAYYATWAREENNSIKNSGRDHSSIATFCGHTILGGVRAQTNHINIDIGTYDTNQFILVNYTKGKCNAFLDQEHPEYNEIKDVINGIQVTLDRLSQARQEERNQKELAIQNSLTALANLQIHLNASDKDASNFTRDLITLVTQVSQDINQTPTKQINSLAEITDEIKQINNLIQAVSDAKPYNPEQKKSLQELKGLLMGKLINLKTDQPHALKKLFLDLWELTEVFKDSTNQTPYTVKPKTPSISSFFKNDKKAFIKNIDKLILNNETFKSHAQKCNEAIETPEIKGSNYPTKHY